MTLVATKDPDSVSQDSYWDSEELPPAEIAVEELPPDATHLINAPEKVCPTCGDEIVREAGRKGRLPKYHDACRPVRGKGSSGPRPVRVSSKERLIAEQVEEALAQIESKVNRAIILLALADPYDALVLRVNLPDLLNNLRPILMQFAWARNAAVNTTAGASLVGFIISLLTIALPIAAHHKIIPQGKVAQILINIPVFMHRMQKEMLEDDGNLTDSLFARVKEKAMQEQQKRMRQQAAYEESVNASNTG